MTEPNKPPFPASRPSGAPDGFHFEWAIDAEWVVVDGTNLGCKRCRWMMPTRRACGVPSVAAFKRPHRSAHDHFGWRWWHYCEDHMYGRILHDGAVWTARMVRD